MDVHVDVNENRRDSQGKGLLRRRVVFELSEEQMPLLQAAEERHGTKRAALLAALSAEAKVDELITRAEQAEQALAKAERSAKAGASKKASVTAKAKDELARAERKLATQQAELARLQSDGDAPASNHRAEMDELLVTLEGRNESLAELQRRAVDWLYCGRCEKWAPPAEWSWTRMKGGGSYAHHRPCGDHRPGLLGTASWLAQRRGGANVTP